MTRPVLKLDDVAFRISAVAEREPPHTFNSALNNRAHRRATSADNPFQDSLNVLHFEREVGKPLAICSRCRRLQHLVVLKDFKAGPTLDVTRQTQMYTSDTGRGNPGRVRQPFAGEVTFGGHRGTP